MTTNEAKPVAATDASFAATVLGMLLDNGQIRRVLVGARSSTEYRAAIDGLLH